MNVGSSSKKIMLNDDVISEIFDNLGIQCKTCLTKFYHPDQIHISVKCSSSVYQYKRGNYCWYYCSKACFNHC